MIRSAEKLIEACTSYNDTAELAAVLRELSADDEFGPTAAYYMRESAIHMEAMFSDYMETVRALAVLAAQAPHTDAAQLVAKFESVYGQQPAAPAITDLGDTQ